MKNNFILRIFLIVIFSASINSCRTEEESLVSNLSQQNIQTAKNAFEKENPKFKILEFVEKIDWEHAIVSSGENFDAVEVPLTLSEKYALSNDGTIEKPYHRLLFRKSKKNKTWDMWYLFISADSHTSIDSITYDHLNKDFKGKIVIFDKNNNLVDHLSFNLPPSREGREANTTTCTYLGWVHEGGGFEAIMLMGCYGDLPGGGPGYPNYGNPSPPHGGTGSGAGGGANGTAMTMAPPPNITIPDVKKFLSCLNITQSANLRIYAQKTDILGQNGVGHAFISISQGNNTMTFGFYPKYGLSQSITGPGIFGDDSGHAYTNVWNVGTISPTQLQQIIAATIAYSTGTYDLGYNNCADFALTALGYGGFNTNTSGIDAPNTVLGIINAHTSNTSGGNALQTHRTCN